MGPQLDSGVGWAWLFDIFSTTKSLFKMLIASLLYLQDVKLLIEDIGELKPTIFCAVPRVLDRIHSGKVSDLLECLWVIDAALGCLSRWGKATWKYTCEKAHHSFFIPPLPCGNFIAKFLINRHGLIFVMLSGLTQKISGGGLLKKKLFDVAYS